MTERRIPGAVVLTCPCCGAYLGTLVQSTPAVAVLATTCPACDNESRLFVAEGRVIRSQYPALGKEERGRRLP